jgi:hypothetical protein
LSKRILFLILAVFVIFAGWSFTSRSRATTQDDPVMALAAPASSRTLATTAVAVVHVAPNGLPSNDGSAERPRDLASALSAQSPANPGDMILLHGGTYTGNFTSDLRGAESAPIVVRGKPGERVTLVAPEPTEPALTANGLYTWFADFEITSAKPERTTDLVQNVPIRRGVGVLVGTASHLKFINLVVHDLQGGFTIPAEAPGIEVYGNVIYYNGWQRADGVGEGHGVLSPNQSDGRFIRDNIIFDQFSHGIQVYGSGVDNVLIEGNTVFNNGSIAKFLDRNIMVGGGSKNLVVAANMTYFTAGTAAIGESVNIGFGGDCVATTITDNYFTGSNPLNLTKCRPSEMRGNTVHGRFDPEDAKRYPGNDYMVAKAPPTPTMSGVKVFVRPSQYDPGRANITVFNWDRLPTVSIDAAAAQLRPSDEYVIQNAADILGPPVASGTYQDGPLVVPMRSLAVARPVGAVTTAPVSTAPEFAVFVLINKTRGGGVATR